MSDKFANKYRIESSRLQNWNYGCKGRYFITICTKGRACYFGTVEEGQMILSEIGEIVKSEWLKSPEIRPDMNLVIDQFMVMPNHFHGIIIIGENEYNIGGRDAMHGVSTSDPTNDVATSDPMHGVSTTGPQIKNLSSIIRGFKSAVTIGARKINPDFGWQTRFHDHVIRNDKTLYNIRKYIRDNPKNWVSDELNI